MRSSATPDGLAGSSAGRWRTFHVRRPTARAVSISQSTELGTVYSRDELRALAAAARQHGLAVHVDGAEHVLVSAGRSGLVLSP